MRHQVRSIGILTILLLSVNFSFAQSSPKKPPISSLSSLIELALNKSLDQSSAKSETAFQEETAHATSLGQKIPSVSLAATYGRYNYDRPYINGAGDPISNNGQRTAYGVTISYDLQKLFGGESEVAKHGTYLAKLQEKISARDIVRQVKKGYFAITEIRSEIDELNKLIVLFDRIDGVLQKQKKIGIDNTIEQKQFQVQKSILTSDLQTRTSDLEAVYAQLSLSTNIEIQTLKELVPQISLAPTLRFASAQNLDPEKLANTSDQEILENLGRDYSLAKLDYDKFSSLPLPTVYIKGSRETPTMPSAEGPQTITEVGISFPLDGFFTRSAQKSALGAKVQKSELLYQKSLLDYRNQIRLNILNLNRFKSQTSPLETTRTEAKGLLDKSFLYFSQKRIDVLGTLDIFQKYLQAARNSLMNTLQIQTTDSELEYLVGGGDK